MMARFTRFLIIVMVLAAAACDVHADMLGVFPAQISGAAVDGQARAYDSKTIFDYMDGAAEPYLRFGFRQLYAAAYALAGKPATVEVYDMGSSADAYGIYSMDLTGRKLSIGQGALYNPGTLRCWKDRCFIKVYSIDDSKAFADFASAIAKRITTSIAKPGPMPALISQLPTALHPTKIRYFHQCDELNSVYYVSTENVLELGETTSAVFADCAYAGKPVKAAVIRYARPADREKAWQHFIKTIFSKRAVSVGGARLEEVRKASFAGIRRFSGAAGEPMLALCFEAKSAQTCKVVINAIAGAVR